MTLLKIEEFAYHVSHTLQLKKVNDGCIVLLTLTILWHFCVPSSQTNTQTILKLCKEHSASSEYARNK